MDQGAAIPQSENARTLGRAEERFCLADERLTLWIPPAADRIGRERMLILPLKS
jgi:hypothetical protein